MRKTYLFTSESVSEGHPDKVADQISDAILDDMIRQDATSKVACETFVTTGLVVCGGEVKSKGYSDIQSIVRNTIKNIGYTKSDYEFDYKSCSVLSAIHEQSPDINQGVDKDDQGAGDQGIMFGYATNETKSYIPLTLDISHGLLKKLSEVRKTGAVMRYLRPDSKSQVTIEYDYETKKPVKIDTIVVSTQHDPFDENDNVMLNTIKTDIETILIPLYLNDNPEYKYLFDGDYKLLVNPTGKFVIGGPSGDCGLTGRKIVVDQYGGKAPVGGGAFSGKDPSKVDRSAAYACRWIAKNMVASGLADEILIQISYAIGVSNPTSIMIDTLGTNKTKYSDYELSNFVKDNIDLRPKSIIDRLKLLNPIYLPTASYGHFGRESYVENGYEFFTWEKLDMFDTFSKLI